MARSTDFDLAKELVRKGFTPGQRDIAGLIALVRADEATAQRAAPALATLGEAARTALLTAIEDATVEEGGAARLVSALGLLARAADDAAKDALVARLADPRVRVRRAAIVALGKLGATRSRESTQAPVVELRAGDRRRDESRSEDAPAPVLELREGDRRTEARRDGDGLAAARTALLARWDATDVPPDEKRALAEALGKLGGDAARTRLEALDATEDRELARRRDRAILVADREAQRGETSTIATDLAPPAGPLRVRLGCRAGVAPLLVEEITAVLGVKPVPVRDDAVELSLDKPWAWLFASRLWASAAIRISDPGLRAAKGEPAALTVAITKAILSRPVRALMTAWTRGPVRWRLSLARGHQRAVVWNVARDVTAAAPEMINDPSQTTWDIFVDDAEGALELVPRRMDDPRFAYRVAEVPAASHPTVAAALVRLALLQPRDRVWDPFCGSGVELVEAARRGVGGALVGTDVAAEALAAATQNLAAAEVTAQLALGDARSHEPGAIDAIVTNPPLGSRVHVDAGALLAASAVHFARVLAPGGRLVWITPQWRRTSPAVEAAGFSLARDLHVDLGGIRGRMERWIRR